MLYALPVILSDSGPCSTRTLYSRNVYDIHAGNFTVEYTNFRTPMRSYAAPGDFHCLRVWLFYNLDIQYVLGLYLAWQISEYGQVESSIIQPCGSYVQYFIANFITYAYFCFIPQATVGVLFRVLIDTPKKAPWLVRCGTCVFLQPLKA